MSVFLNNKIEIKNNMQSLSNKEIINLLKNLTLIPKMNKKDVNNLLNKFNIPLEFCDNEYINREFEHNWKNKNCKRGTFKRTFRSIKTKGVLKCNCKHCLKERSIGYYIENVLKLKLCDIWDFENNNIKDKDGKLIKLDPFSIPSGSSQLVYLKCINKKYHSHTLLKVRDIKNRSYLCDECAPSKPPNYFDSLGFLYFNIAKSITRDKNHKNISILDTYKIRPYSHQEFDFRCEFCNSIFQNLQLSNVTQSGTFCTFCRDGYSIPEKFVYHCLKQIKENSIQNLYIILDIKKRHVFEWSKKYLHKSNAKLSGYKEYDFLIKVKNIKTNEVFEIIIETHGRQHYSSECDFYRTFKSKARTFHEEVENDEIKKKLALDNGFIASRYIVINCSFNRLNYLKENFIKQLESLFSMDTINFYKALSDSASFINNICEYFNTHCDEITIDSLAKKFNLCRDTVRSYLVIGSDLGKCIYEDYNTILQINLYKFPPKITNFTSQVNTSNSISNNTDDNLRKTINTIINNKHNGRKYYTCNGSTFMRKSDFLKNKLDKNALVSIYTKTTLAFDYNTNKFLNIFTQQNIAAKYYDITPQTVNKSIKNKKPTNSGIIFYNLINYIDSNTLDNIINNNINNINDTFIEILNYINLL